MPVRSAARRGKCPGRTPNWPATLGAVTSETCSRSTTPVGVTISRWSDSAAAMLGGLLARGACLHFVDIARVNEVLLADVVELAIEDLLEAVDRVLEADQLADCAGELRGDEEGLGKEL